MIYSNTAMYIHVCTHRQEKKVRELEEEIERERRAAEPLVASMVCTICSV